MFLTLLPKASSFGEEDDALVEGESISNRLKSIPGQMSFKGDCRFDNLEVFLDPGTKRILELQPVYFAFRYALLAHEYFTCEAFTDSTKMGLLVSVTR